MIKKQTTQINYPINNNFNFLSKETIKDNKTQHKITKTTKMPPTTSSPAHQSTTPQAFTSQNPPEPQYYYFRGHKKRLAEMNKTKMLKTKRVKEKEQKVLRYDEGEEEVVVGLDMENSGWELGGEDIGGMRKDENYNHKDSSRAESHRRVKSQFQIMKMNPIDKLQRMHRNKSTAESHHHQLMIRTSRMQITQPPQRFSTHFTKNSTSLQPTNLLNEQPAITKFYSKNLQERMNEYLNMVVAKSSKDHDERVKRIREEEQVKMGEQRYRRGGMKERDGKMFVKNKFLRELKTRANLIKKNGYNIGNSNNSSHSNYSQQLNNYQSTSRSYHAQTSRTSNPIISRQKDIPNYSYSRISNQNQSIHNHMSGNGKMAQGEELINFASEVLSKSMKVYGSARGKSKDNSVKRLNCSVQVVANNK